MSIITETRLRDFEFWGGAVPVAKRLTLQELDKLGKRGAGITAPFLFLKYRCAHLYLGIAKFQ